MVYCQKAVTSSRLSFFRTPKNLFVVYRTSCGNSSNFNRLAQPAKSEVTEPPPTYQSSSDNVTNNFSHGNNSLREAESNLNLTNEQSHGPAIINGNSSILPKAEIMICNLTSQSKCPVSDSVKVMERPTDTLSLPVPPNTYVNIGTDYYNVTGSLGQPQNSDSSTKHSKNSIKP